MTEYWIVKPDEIKNLDADSLSPLEFSNFRHGEYFEKHQGAYYYATDKMAHVSLMDAASELSAPFMYHLVEANYPYDGLEGARSSVDLLCDATEAKREGASEALLQNRLDCLTQGRPSERQCQNLKTWTKPREEWREQYAYFVVHDGQDAYLVRRNTDRIYLLGHGKESQFLDSCSKVLQITEDGQWVDGRMGAGVSLEVNGSHKFPYSEVPKDLATKYFDEFQVETNVLKRNDIYLVEYGANEDKAKLFTFPHSDQSETKVQAMTKPYSNLQITKLVEDGKPVNGFEVTPEIENILVKTNQLTDEQHKDIQMAIVDDSLESALSDLVDDTTQLGL